MCALTASQEVDTRGRTLRRTSRPLSLEEHEEENDSLSDGSESHGDASLAMPSRALRLQHSVAPSGFVCEYVGRLVPAFPLLPGSYFAIGAKSDGRSQQATMSCVVRLSQRLSATTLLHLLTQVGSLAESARVRRVGPIGGPTLVRLVGEARALLQSTGVPERGDTCDTLLCRRGCARKRLVELSNHQYTYYHIGSSYQAL